MTTRLMFSTFWHNCSSVQTIHVEDRPACAALTIQQGKKGKTIRISSLNFTQ